MRSAAITHKLMDWERQAILDAYLAGEKVDAIGAEFDVSKAYPSMLAKRNGHPTRTGGPKGKQSPSSMLVA